MDILRSSVLAGNKYCSTWRHHDRDGTYSGSRRKLVSARKQQRPGETSHKDYGSVDLSYGVSSEMISLRKTRKN